MKNIEKVFYWIKEAFNPDTFIYIGVFVAFVCFAMLIVAPETLLRILLLLRLE